MCGTKGACARSILTLSCGIEINASGRDVVQVDGVMEQCDCHGTGYTITDEVMRVDATHVCGVEAT